MSNRPFIVSKDKIFKQNVHNKQTLNDRKNWNISEPLN